MAPEKATAALLLLMASLTGLIAAKISNESPVKIGGKISYESPAKIRGKISYGSPAKIGGSSYESPVKIGRQVSYVSPVRMIGTGSIISPSYKGKSTWTSVSGKFAFGFYQEAGKNYSVGIQLFHNSSYSTVIWTANRDGRQRIPFNATLTFGNEGLVLHLDEGDLTVTDQYDGTNLLAFASMHDSGNFVVYDANQNVAWQTFDYPTDTLMDGQEFHAGQSLISSDSESNHSSGRFRFAMQRDGNAVLYPVNTEETATNAYWAHNETYNQVLFGRNGYLNSSQVTGLTSFFRLDSDGYLRVYSNLSGLMAASKQYPPEDNKCLIKGVCGLNSYCHFNFTKKIGEVSCSCLPGFDFIDPSINSAGCQRNFIMGTCEAVLGANISKSNLGDFYNASKWLNITMYDDSYSSFQVQSSDDCSLACLEDCNCYAALFFPLTQRCSKQRQPFQYGRLLISKEETTTAFFKVGHAQQRSQPSPNPVVIGSLRNLKTLPLVLSLLLTAISAIALDLLIFFLCRSRIGMYRRLCESMETGLAKAMAPRFFSYRQLEDATDGYSDKIGEGTYGKVFKGQLLPRDGHVAQIAVKKLNSVPVKLEEKFRNELKSIGRVHHRNLVRLLGFCHRGSDWILVYEHMAGGSLADLIFKSQGISPPSWMQRVGIAMDVARGLSHLHHGCDDAIIHGDIKPENVLIGSDGRAKIADLGLAKHIPPGKHMTYTHLRGSPDYTAPEWANSYNCVSTKVDVVSFGVLLLELLCLKQYRQPQGLDGEYNLASWAYKCLKGRSELLQVPGRDVDAKELESMVKVALWCLVGSPEKRPSMYDVLMMLRGKKAVAFPPVVPLLDWGTHVDAGQPPIADAQRW